MTFHPLHVRLGPAARRRLVPTLVAFAVIAIAAAWLGAEAAHGHSSPVPKAEAPPPPAEVARGRGLAEGLSAAFEEASSVVSSSVVAILTDQPVPHQRGFELPGPFGDDLFRFFFGGRPQGLPGEWGDNPVLHGLGSGVIVSADGLVLTNNHVVTGAEKLTVLLHDNRRFPAKVIGTDPPTDLAVIRIDGDVHELPVARLGDSDRLRVGQWVIAVGNPFRLLRTVTAGISSARGRSAIGLADYEDFIQTDASINPGNSGGALADLDGEVVGINTAISSPSGGNVGIGFAIPINMARQVMDQLVTKGEVSRGYLALAIQDVDPDLARALDLKTTEGALVADVTPGGPGDRAGIRRGDVITAFAGQPIHDSADLRQKVAQALPASHTDVAVQRDGHPQHLDVVLAARPAGGDDDTAATAETDRPAGRLGLEVQPLTPGLARQLGVDDDVHGVAIVRVAPGSVADDAGLRPGDIVLEVDRTAVASPAELQRLVSRHSSGDSIALLLRRGTATIYVGLRVP